MTATYTMAVIILIIQIMRNLVKNDETDASSGLIIQYVGFKCPKCWVGWQFAIGSICGPMLLISYLQCHFHHE